jgi:hypothetical protein
MIEELERGRVYFLFRPKVNVDRVVGIDDVDRVFMILHPENHDLYRLIGFGDTKLPTTGGERMTAFVDRIALTGEELSREFRSDTEKRELPSSVQGSHFLGPARPAGEGVYVLFTHDDHSLLSYVRELPAETGEVQRALGILDQHVLRLSVRNPDRPPLRVEGPDGRSADFPTDLRELFSGQSFHAVDPPDFLNYEGAELLIVGLNRHAAEDFGIDSDPEFEEPTSAELFADLQLSRREMPTDPLFNGRWE